MTNITYRNNIVHCGILFRVSPECSYHRVALWVVPFPRLRVPGLVPSPSQSCWDGFRQHHLPAHLEKL